MHLDGDVLLPRQGGGRPSIHSHQHTPAAQLTQLASYFCKLLFNYLWICEIMQTTKMFEHFYFSGQETSVRNLSAYMSLDTNEVHFSAEIAISVIADVTDIGKSFYYLTANQFTLVYTRS